jgi:hypothetical protein
MDYYCDDLICERCGSHDAKMQKNPFSYELNNDETEYALCDDCVYQLGRIMGIKSGPPDKPPKTPPRPKPMDELKKSPDWLLYKLEEASNRYIEAENLLCDLLPFWKRVFGYKKIRDYLEKVIKGI